MAFADLFKAPVITDGASVITGALGRTLVDVSGFGIVERFRSLITPAESRTTTQNNLLGIIRPGTTGLIEQSIANVGNVIGGGQALVDQARQQATSARKTVNTLADLSGITFNDTLVIAALGIGAIFLLSR